MLTLSLREGDYFMIGDNIKIVYNRSTGKDCVHINVEAPKNLRILRGQLFEAEIADRARSNDKEAQKIRDELLEMHELRDKDYERRRKLRKKYRDKVVSGEIEPNVPVDLIVEKEERRIAAREKERKVLAGVENPYKR